MVIKVPVFRIVIPSYIKYKNMGVADNVSHYLLVAGADYRDVFMKKPFESDELVDIVVKLLS